VAKATTISSILEPARAILVVLSLLRRSLNETKHILASTGIKVLTTPSHAPRANAICERFLGSVRRECLDHLLIASENQLHHILLAYLEYFKRARPHQGIRQRVPEREVTCVPSAQPDERIISVSVLGGLHHDYRRVA
jgi:putative transposase